MTTRTRLPKPRPTAVRAHTRRLTERVQLTKGRVDADAGIIFDVKILGHESDNNRYYTPEAIRAAVPLYEGRFVNIDHPDKPTAQRSSLDRTAWLENVRYVEGDGLRGDLHFLLPLDSYQQKVIWAAENKPNAWGLSHNADGKGEEDRHGRFVVAAITEVRSVDLVPEPATNRSLFEGKPVTTTLRQLIEATPARKAFFKTFLEMPEDEAPPLDMPMDLPAEPAAEDPKTLLVKAIGAYVATGSPEDYDTARKLLNMLKPAGADTSAETTTEGEEEDEDEDKEGEKDKPMESRKAKVAPDTLTLTEAKTLCKLAGVTEDAGLLAMLDGSPRAKALSLLEWAKGKVAAPTKTNGVRSQGPIGHGTSVNGTTGAKSDEEFEKRVLQRR